jgi:UDP-N-acetylmuramate: L-alanyl-gamma-D-glutamyl-meso-diaminopimelate ligase
VQTFGLGEAADWRASELVEGEGETRFLIHGPEGAGPWPTRIGLAGDFNVRNALAAVAAAHAAGAPAEEAARHLPLFRGVRRRLELLGEIAGVRLYDDFAHHPTSVGATLAGLRRREPRRRLVAVLEPRSNTLRRRVFEKELADALESADEVVLAGVHRAHLLNEEDRLDTAALAGEIARRGTKALSLPGADEILAHLLDDLAPGDTVVIMSNGSFDGLPGRLAEALTDRSS